MYCIKCGVELSDSKKPCPLCKTVPYHPDLASETDSLTYPPFVKPQKKMKRGVVMLFITLFYAIVAAQLVLCNVIVSHNISWSAYAIGGMALFYEAVLLPLWFKKPNPVIFTPCFFICAELYLLFVNFYTGGSWFLSFAFPVAGIAGVIVSTVVTLIKYVKKGYFYIAGGTVIAIGAFTVLVEYFSAFTFSTKLYLWSVYPASGCFILGIFLILLGICKPIRAWFAKKFFI